jgi:hypothetical protein
MPCKALAPRASQRTRQDSVRKRERCGNTKKYEAERIPLRRSMALITHRNSGHEHAEGTRIRGEPHRTWRHTVMVVSEGRIACVASKSRVRKAVTAMMRDRKKTPSPSRCPSRRAVGSAWLNSVIAFPEFQGRRSDARRGEAERHILSKALGSGLT